MNRKLADDIAATNTEFEKLKSDRADDDTPRETPRRQAPGNRGLRRPELEKWTTDELRSSAAVLGIQNAAVLDHDELVERLIAAESRRA